MEKITRTAVALYQKWLQARIAEPAATQDDSDSATCTAQPAPPSIPTWAVFVGNVRKPSTGRASLAARRTLRILPPPGPEGQVTIRYSVGVRVNGVDTGFCYAVIPCGNANLCREAQRLDGTELSTLPDELITVRNRLGDLPELLAQYKLIQKSESSVQSAIKAPADRVPTASGVQSTPSREQTPAWRGAEAPGTELRQFPNQRITLYCHLGEIPQVQALYVHLLERATASSSRRHLVCAPRQKTEI
ncbi:hypothetical protein B0H17DRAFT_1204606 [Mycena rosella]|uniref:Uncharacterized protein n=1 Tax=Mycena rosella TaxID=1033263 RepID=A0AAD7DAE8_MYCRO|nr:hypothetical protein B0H17DRAFT_1204606 [Mycena rosella]